MRLHATAQLEQIEADLEADIADHRRSSDIECNFAAGFSEVAFVLCSDR